MPSDGIFPVLEGSIKERMLDAPFIDHIDLPLKLIPKAHIIIKLPALILLHPAPPLPSFFLIFCGLLYFIGEVLWMAYIYQQMMVQSFLAIVLLGLMRDVACAAFCSSVCGTKCDGNLNTDCANSCQSTALWSASGNTCTPKNSAQWYLYASTSDYAGGTLTVTGAATTYTCDDVVVYGLVNAGSTISISLPAGITVPYYQMQIYMGILAVDVSCSGGGGSGGGCGGLPSNLWSTSTTAFFTTFNDPQLMETTATNPIVNMLKSKFATSRMCQLGSTDKYNEYWMRTSRFYSVYNITNTPLQWDVTCNQTTNSSAMWGIREFLVLVHTCHPYCSQCYGALNTQCYFCFSNATVTYWQSNNTCDTACLSRFGYSAPNFCVYCDLRCTACHTVLDNCTACTTSGIWTAYLSTTVNPNYPTCVNPCPDGYFANKTSRTCDLCNSSCATCLNSATYCTSCIADYYWTGWFCYSPCPTQYFLDPNGTNCTRCSPFCNVCEGVFNVCTVCTLSGQFKAYLYNTTSLSGSCERICPNGYYGETYSGAGPNLCLACNANCSLCTGNPTPCTQCIPGFYLFSGTCLDSCPNGTIASNATGSGLCLDCNTYCVDLTISMYFPSVVSDMVYIDMQFNQDLDYSTFSQADFQNITITSENLQYTLDMFTVTYTNLSSSAYRITLAPKTYIFLYNATFTVTTQAQPTPIDYSTSLMPFKTSNYGKTASLTWFLIKGPPFSNLQVGIMNSLSKLSTKTNYVLTLPYVQQIKKSGVFNLLFSGAQITSCSMLSNQIQSQNLYEGVRIWATFVFFDAPAYEQISDKTKRFVSPTVQDKIRNAQQIDQQEENQRLLFSTDTMYWRFQRTGQTSFFIYDVYMPMFLIGLCWLAVALAHFCKQRRWYAEYAANIYSSVHKIHQMSLMYITMAAIVQFIYFQPSSSERIISAIVCVVFNVYFALYELYIYHDMIRYPLAQIGNSLYDYYVVRYGYFLKNVRYEEYDVNQEWTPRQWLRPYNFHILSYYKKFVMMISLPLFYSVSYAQMGILSFIQLLEMFRVWKTWPFLSYKRNVIRMTLQASLFLFFLINLIQINILQTIMEGDAAALESATAVFYGLGWAGFAFCTYFNLTYVCMGIYDLCVGLRVTNRTKMDNARKKYYYSKIKQYEKDNQASSKELVGRWVKLGNLSGKSYGALPEINVRLEFYEIKKVANKFQVTIKKITSLRMKSVTKLRKANNTTAGGKIQRKVVLSQADNSRLYSIISDVYRAFQGPHVETIRLKTFLNIWQKDYRQGDPIAFDRNMMFQRVELLSYDNESNQSQLQAMLQDFPIDPKVIQNAL